MTRILLLSYYWPPAGGPGVQRWVKMSNELVALGHQVTVITVADGSYPSRDDSLIAEVDQRIQVIKTKTREPFAWFNRLRGERSNEASVGMIGLSDNASLLQRIAVYVRANFFVPDARMGWRPYAHRAAIDIVKNETQDIVISSGPPHSVHAVAQGLHAKYNTPWIADLRDPWVNIYYHEQMPLSKRAKRKHQALEDETLLSADAVTVVSPGMKREFQDRAKQVEVIYNGYDEADFEPERVADPNERFTIRYTGNLKPNQKVPALWDALAELCNELEEFKEQALVELIGKKDPRIFKQQQARLPKGVLISESPVPHRDAVEAMCSADLLLFIIPQASNNQLILTGKLFEYLAACKPMLSIGPTDGDAANILADAGRAPMLPYVDKEAIKAQIASAFTNWKRSEQASPRIENDEHKKYSRKAQSSAYASLIKGLID